MVAVDEEGYSFVSEYDGGSSPSLIAKDRR